MDYKLFFILLIIIGVGFYFLYQEISAVYRKIDTVVLDIRDTMAENTNIIRNEYKTQLANQSDKIKDNNFELLQQFRRISTIENQPIKKIINHFTEPETEFDSSNKINYLSDVNEAPKNDQIKQKNDSLYMSKSFDDNKKKNDVNLNTSSDNATSIFQNSETSSNKSSRKESENTFTEDSEEICESELKIVKIESPTKAQSTLLIIDFEEKKEEIKEEIKGEIKEEIKGESPIVKESPIIKESKNDEITLGSKRNKEIEIKFDEKSIDTTEIKNMKQLKSEDKYTIPQLKKIAKEFNISLSVKVDGKWKGLSKIEIYNAIKLEINKKK